MIDTSHTRYEIEENKEGLLIFKGWKKFLQQEGLTEFNHFYNLSGTEMDRNRRSVVYRIELGREKQPFYIKIHKNFFKKNLTTLYKKISISEIELSNLMHYARAGFDELEPIAWGYRNGKENISFLLLRELNGYVSLLDWLQSSAAKQMTERASVSVAVAKMLSQIHSAGIAHMDLFSWHVFIKKTESGYAAHPIDLERSRLKSLWPWSIFLFFWNRANDLAALNLTCPWPQISFSRRMKFYRKYCQLSGLKDGNSFFLKTITAISRHRGRRNKFKKYGVFSRLQS